MTEFAGSAEDRLRGYVRHGIEAWSITGADAQELIEKVDSLSADREVLRDALWVAYVTLDEPNMASHRGAVLNAISIIRLSLEQTGGFPHRIANREEKS